jgi:hypothetical protein
MSKQQSIADASAIATSEHVNVTRILACVGPVVFKKYLVLSVFTDDKAISQESESYAYAREYVTCDSTRSVDLIPWRRSSCVIGVI